MNRIVNILKKRKLTYTSNTIISIQQHIIENIFKLFPENFYLTPGEGFSVSPSFYIKTFPLTPLASFRTTGNNIPG